MHEDQGRWKRLIREFLRYLVVGGTAFLVDYATLYLLSHFVFQNMGNLGVYLATAIGFIAGLTYNYVLSLIWVFQSAKERNKGKSIGGFALFSLIGIIGLLLTEGGMYVGFQLLQIHYMIVKLFVAAFVLLWNYGARKLLIFRDVRAKQ